MPGPIERLFPNLSHGQRVVIDWVVTLVGATLIVLAVKAWIVNPYRIPSPSMEPALHCARPEPYCESDRSDRVLANRFIYHFRDPRRGEIVVFHAPEEASKECTGGIFVKRDTKTMFDIPPAGTLRRIPPDMYLMEGDNRAHSCDSRVWGLVERSALIGKVFLTYWPLDRIGVP